LIPQSDSQHHSVTLREDQGEYSPVELL